MRNLALTAAAFVAMTTFATAEEAKAPAGPVQLSEAQLDDVTAGRARAKLNSSRIRYIRQNAVIQQSADAVAFNIVEGACIGFCGAIAIGGTNIAFLNQSAN